MQTVIKPGVMPTPPPEFKQQEPEWKVLHNLEEGFTEYIEYKVRSGAG